MTPKINHLVKIINDGHQYTTFEEWATRHAMTGYVNGWRDTDLLEGHVGRVVAVGVHTPRDLRTYTDDETYLVLGVELKNGKQIIIGIEGVEVVGVVQHLDEDLFTL